MLTYYFSITSKCVNYIIVIRIVEYMYIYRYSPKGKIGHKHGLC